MSTSVAHARASIRAVLEQALDEVDKNLASEWSRKEKVWRDQYNALRSSSETSHQALAGEVKTLKATVASLLAELQACEVQYGNKTHSARAREDNRPEPLSNDRVEDSTGNEADVNSNVAQLKQRVETAERCHRNAVKSLKTAIDMARRRKAEVQRWIEYAESLEKKIKRLEKKANDKSDKENGKKRAQVTVTPLVPSAEPATTSAPSAEKPNFPLTPVTAEKPAYTEVAKPTLSASFSSSTSPSLLSDKYCVAEEEPVLPLLEMGLAPTDTAAPSAIALGNDTVSNDTGLDSTQGEPLSDEQCPALEQALEQLQRSVQESEPELPSRGASTFAQNDLYDSGQVVVKQEPSSDALEVVWERPAKRLRRDSSFNIPQPQHELAVAIKMESTERTAAYRDSQESIDLDEGQLALRTPRKKQHIFDVPPQSSPTSCVLDETVLQEQAGESPANGRHGDSDADASDTHSTAQKAPLAPLSVNVPCSTVRASASRSLKRGVAFVAEDNDSGRPQSPSQLLKLLLNKPLANANVISTPDRTCYHTAMARPMTGDFGEPPPPRTLPQLSSKAPIQPKTLPAGRSSAASFTSPRASSGTARPLPDAATATTVPGPTPATVPRALALMEAKAARAAVDGVKNTRLRDLPTDQLTVDDFKINSARNDGASFAYNEVVRRRADRNSLAGCTDPKCCGKAFRAMAVSELAAATASGGGANSGSSPAPHALFPNAAAAESAHISKPDSVAMMEQYLGESAYALARMSQSEMRELWIEARTHQLAGKFGKHRHRFHRRTSPPGFWDVDFPTTQDEERYRAESAKLERAAILERYREAMQPGGKGRWLFRDE